MKLSRCVLILIVSFSGLLACDNKDDSSKKKPPGKITEMTVGDQKIQCPTFLGSVPETADCLAAQEDGFDYVDPLWRIEGFEYEPGFIYRLRVEVIPVEKPMADAPDVQYRLVEILSKTPVQ